MRWGFYFITNSVVNNRVKTEEDIESDSFQVRVEFEAGFHLASLGIMVIVLLFCYYMTIIQWLDTGI